MTRNASASSAIALVRHRWMARRSLSTHELTMLSVTYLTTGHHVREKCHITSTGITRWSKLAFAGYFGNAINARRFILLSKRYMSISERFTHTKTRSTQSRCSQFIGVALSL